MVAYGSSPAPAPAPLRLRFNPRWIRTSVFPMCDSEIQIFGFVLHAFDGFDSDGVGDVCEGSYTKSVSKRKEAKRI